MLLRRSGLAAHPAERPRLAPLWLIALLAAFVGIALFLLYPRQDLERLIAATPDTPLAEAYLDNLLRSDPNNPQLRLLLARRQARLGQGEKARQTLQPALQGSDASLRQEARWVLWNIEEQLAGQAATRSPVERLSAEARIRALLQELVRENWPLERQMALAGKAFQLGEGALGSRIYQGIAASIGDPDEAATLFAHAADTALGSGDYTGSAELYLLARQSATAPPQARRYLHAALRTLQSGNQPLAAVEMGERSLGEFADDPETLILMVGLARAAGRPDIADRYVRQLLRLSLHRQWQALQIARAWGDGSFLGVSARALPRGPGIAFDDKIYTLGYDVFLEAGKLEDAWQVANSAVRQAPDDPAWRERLARVAEWTNRPQVALDNWLKLAQLSDKEEAWQAVLRIAPGLFDDGALIPALRRELAQRPGDLRLIGELVAAYERLGEPLPAIALLERQTRPELLELLAELAERAGQTETAITAWQRLFTEPRQLTSGRAMRLATLLLQQGRGEEGLQWLERASANAELSSEADVEYWRLTGQIAEIQQQDELAIDVFRRLAESTHADVSDYNSLIRLLADSRPLEAAHLATQAWQRFAQSRHLIQALNLYAMRQRWPEMGVLLRPLDAQPSATRDALAGDPNFLRLLGTWQQNTGQLPAARRSFEAGLRLAPESTDMQQALLWLLIDGNDAAAVRKLLASHEMTWRRNESLHDTLAAAYQALSLPQVALQRYLTPRIAAHRDDFLWLMNYADALDQNQQSDRAWRLRRQLLSAEWQTARGQDSNREARRRWLTEQGLEQTRRLARTRLLLTQRPGDIGREALRELLRLDRDARGNYSNAAAETAIGWLQDAAEYTAERGFLWHQYARSRSSKANRPLWAEITVALAEDDKAATGQLLSEFDERLPRYDRVNAARAVNDLRLAQTAAFEAQSEQTEDDPTHLQLSETLLAFSDSAGLGVAKRELGSIDELLGSASHHLAIAPRLSLDIDAGRIDRQVRDENVIRNVPSETLFNARLNWQHGESETRFTFGQRESFARYTPLQLEHERRLDNRLSFSFALGSQLPAADTLALRVAGMKERAALSLRYRPTRLDQILLEHWHERYQLQTGGELGSGMHTALTYSHTYRQEARDLAFSAFWSRHQYDRKDDLRHFSRQDASISSLYPPGFTPGNNYFLPENFSFYGLRVASNVRHETAYTRAVRPFGSLAGTWHNDLGAGYDIRLGIAGSVFGADHLAMTLGIAKSGMRMQLSGQMRDLQLTYRIHY
jgi:polysaccharide biosynthesis protein PelB